MEKSLSPAMKVETHSHEEVHANDIKNGDFTWDDKKITYKGKNYSKEHFKRGTGPWEIPAYKQEIKAKK